ncbi:L,D-transpeptidase family protein [Hyphomicrobium sp.]|uniref:L,D-transpeptidase family protein n=1 Tax=Hyphomicrobium sp. TaxID=82 RepID=UPI003F6FBF0E
MLRCGNLTLPCALGRGGIVSRKREGDGATPRGVFRFEGGYFRPDARRRPQSSLRLVATRRHDGWCDAADDRNYNRRVSLPYPKSAERLWRDDRQYDVVVVIGYNRRPRRREAGSAIFLHVAREGLRPTEGCVALAYRDVLKVLARIGPETRLVIV